MSDRSTSAVTLAVLLLAAIVGGAYYLLVMRHPAPVSPTPSPKAPTTWQTITPRPGQDSSVASDTSRAPTTTSKGRTDTPIKCFDPEVGEFWTNAATCQDADMNKQLSNPAPQVSSSSPVADNSADETAEGTAGTKADRAKLMGEDYQLPAEAASKSQTDKDN